MGGEFKSFLEKALSEEYNYYFALIIKETAYLMVNEQSMCEGKVMLSLL